MSELDSLEAVKANVLGSDPEGQGLGGPDQEDAGELHLPILQPWEAGAVIHDDICKEKILKEQLRWAEVKERIIW